MSNRHQELTSPEQTATGKDFSNPLIVDSLLNYKIYGKCRVSADHRLHPLDVTFAMLTRSQRIGGVQKLESHVKIGKARKQTRVVLSDDEALSKMIFPNRGGSYLMKRIPIVSTAEVDISTVGRNCYLCKKEVHSKDQDKLRGLKHFLLKKNERDPKRNKKKETWNKKIKFAEAQSDLKSNLNEEQRAQITRDEGKKFARQMG
ncbi:hypothetical protein Tco_0815812 [Tanacetum coccineum]